MESTAGKPPLALLLIDDDAELCGMMRELFGEAGFTLECAFNGRDGLARALKNSYDLIVLDVMLPMVDGFTVLQQLRRRTEVPVIMLTARVHRRDRIEGLNAGADDYLPKPFDPDELHARGVERRAVGGSDIVGVRSAQDANPRRRTRCDARRNYGGAARARVVSVRSVAGCVSCAPGSRRAAICVPGFRSDG